MRSKSSIVLLTVLLASLFSTGCSSINEALKAGRVAATIQEGSRQEDLGNMTEANKFYTSAVNLAPNSALPYIGADSQPDTGLISVLAERENWSLMESYLTKAVISPQVSSRYEVWLALAEAQQRLGELPQSKISYQKVLDDLSGKAIVKGEVITGSSDGNTTQAKAEAEWGVGDFKDARADLMGIIAANPGSGDAALAENDLAYFEADSNTNLPEALDLSTKAVKYLRDNGVTGDGLGITLDTLGWAEHKLGKDSDALSDLEEAIENDPQVSIIHMHLAEVDNALGDKVGAKIEIERAVALCKEDYQVQTAAKQLDPESLTTLPANS